MVAQMKAIVLKAYGSPLKVLRLEEVEKPVPKENEVLVRVHAASITFSNLGIATGTPFFVRLMNGGTLQKPGVKILGSDIAGRVEAVGGKTKQFQPGDEIFGYVAGCGKGGYAEYVCAPEKVLELKPADLSFEEAAAVPEAALVALQALRDYGQIQKGQNVLVYGASGGIGTFAVQIAKYFGAEVTGVCSTKNVVMVRSLGADHVIDYRKEDFLRNGQPYDLIVATAGYRSIFDYQRALKPAGIYVVTGGSWAQVFEGLLLGGRLSRAGGKRYGVLTLKQNRDLALLKVMIETGKVRPVLDRCYPLSQVPEAFMYYGKRHARGKVVITV
jgi:NADPH:quinone reductase-like Zn-dependent oxidoreductase